MPVPLHDIDIPPAWQQALERVCAHPGVIMILGALDTGKSTLARVTLHALQQVGRTAAWVDSDIGQSDLGPPTTVAMTIVHPSTNLEMEAHPEAMRFVGSVSPSGHLLQTVVGSFRMIDLARRRGADAIVMNTTGMVHGIAARTLKSHLIDLIEPDDILALQEQAEIEHLLRPLEHRPSCRIHRLPVSAKVRRRSREERRQIRQERFRAYFQPAMLSVFGCADLSLQNTFLGSGAPLTTKQLADASSTLDAIVVYGERCGDGLYLVIRGVFEELDLNILPEVFNIERVHVFPVSDFQNRLVGLCEASNDLLALGTLEQIDWSYGALHILTPLPHTAFNQVRVVQFGSLRVDRIGQEHPLQRRP